MAMAIPILPILKAIAPLIAGSGGLVASLTERASQNRGGASDERLQKLEQDALRMSQVLAGALEQLQAIAQELRAQSQRIEARQSRQRLSPIVAPVVAGIALCLSIAALFFG